MQHLNKQKPLGCAFRRDIETFQALLNCRRTTDGFLPLSFHESATNCWTPPADFLNCPPIPILQLSFERFCQQEKNLSSRIPSRIHLIWLGASSPPPQALLAMQSWKMHHPNWEVKLWTDADTIDFAWSDPRYLQLFQEAKTESEKSDILRFEILYRYGGIYSDTDVVCFKSFEPLFASGAALFTGIESNWPANFNKPIIGSAIVASVPKSPVIKLCLENTRSEQEASSIPYPLRCGPGPLTEACYEALKKGDNSLVVLPCSYFYPLPGQKRFCSTQELLSHVRTESFSIHLWEGSWLPTPTDLLKILKTNLPRVIQE